jgi:peptidoglycan/xylan/chitin deacetylase (PgdA/CDA1 family)
VALAVILNLEHWDWQLPPNEPGAPAGPFRPDLAGFSMHEYGNRVGVFRLWRILDKYGIKPIIAMDRLVAENYPFLVKECQARGLEVIGHGVSARRTIHAGMSIDAELTYIRESLAALTKAIGKPPVGWLSPNCDESMNTPALLAEEGIRYVCDWSNDEQPYRMKVPKGELFSLGVDLDLDDDFIHMTGRKLIGEYCQIIQDTFDGLYRDGAKTGRMMVISLHPWIMGQPWRSKYLDVALAHIAKSRTGVWKASGSEIVDWYKSHA